MIKTFLKQFTRLPFEKNQPSTIRINSKNDFQYVINRERERADRSGMHFSIIMFDFENIKNPKQSIDKLFKILADRMRISDEVGWIKNNRVGLILYNTLLEPAKKPAQYVAKKFKTESIECPEISIFIYPDDAAAISNFTNDNRNIDRLDVNLQSHLVIKNPNGGTETLNLQTKNISLNGVYLESEKPLTVGTEVKLSIFLPLNDGISIVNDKIAINVAGRVVRAEQNGMAISFVDDNIENRIKKIPDTNEEQ